MPKITVFGCCRQDSLNEYDITSIKNEIAYCHSTREMMEIIKYCKNGHIPPEETVFVLRQPMINRSQLVYDEKYKRELEETDVFFLEISSKKVYRYKDYYSHHSIYTESHDYGISDEKKSEVSEIILTKDEIYNDIIELQKELYNKKMIIITHISNNENHDRDELIEWLEDICCKLNIAIINPVKEIEKLGYKMCEVKDDPNHYNKLGHSVIKTIYTTNILTSPGAA